MRRFLVAALVAGLASCAVPVPADTTTYRTTVGEKPVAWNVKIYNPNRTQLLHEYTQASPGSLRDEMRWQLQPWGDTVTWEGIARNDKFQIPARAVLAFTVDGQPAFWGIAPDVPNPRSKEAERITVLGGREALRVTLMDGAVYRNRGVYSIARDILARLCPPALIYDASQIGSGTGSDAGPTLDTFYMPTAPLTDVLDALAKSAGVQWGVDASGRVFMGRPQTAALNVAYAGQPWRRLPVQDHEVVTRSVLRIVTAPAPSEGVTGVTATDSQPDALYLPASLTTEVTAGEHELYRASAAFSPPEGVGLVKEIRTGTLTSQNMTGADFAVDSDSATAARNLSYTKSLEPAGLIDLELNDPTVRVVGLRVKYSLATSESVELEARMLYRTASGGVVPMDSLKLPLQPSEGGATVTMIAPPSQVLSAAGVGIVTGRIALYPSGDLPADSLYIYDLSLLVIDEYAALNLAASYLQPPYESPAEITLKGIHPPTQTAQITGTPDGDVTTPPALFEYVYSPNDSKITKVRLGSTGQDQTVRALKLAVQR